LQALEIVWRTALVLSAIGLFTRGSMWVAAVLGVYFFGLPHNYGHVFHFARSSAFTRGATMLKNTRAFSSFSVDDLQKAKAFYGQTLGVRTSTKQSTS
jgi:hypothetical protein